MNIASVAQAVVSGVSQASGLTDATDQMIVDTLDAILESKTIETAFCTEVYLSNAASMYKNTRGEYVPERNKAVVSVISTIRDMKSKVNVNKIAGVTDVLLQATVQPNLAGIPISSASITTNREVEVSESMVIVQSSYTKQYWTDNAVPRLKEWSVEGYLTSVSPLDNGCLIKPSLVWQAYYLDVCAKSRRPVLFKTNHGEFVKVQITNLHTEEVADYNNAIKISVSLKEYNPYFVDSQTGQEIVAVFVGTRGN